MTVRFQWDEDKARSNEEKHDITFDEAQSVFFDKDAVFFDVPDHSHGEQRFILIGVSTHRKVLTVCHCDRSIGEIETIRIISARRANKREIEAYKNRWT
jgi:uncharacterized DUF497 family protein